MSATPLVSIILPTFNRAHLLPRAITSVLSQSYPNFELIIVDDASGDDTATVVGTFDDPRVVFLPLDRNLGDAGARNRGVERARGEWLAFQDSDDEWLPEKLAQQMAIAATLPAAYAGVASSLIRSVGGPVDSITWPTRATDQPYPDVDRDAFIAGFSAYLQSLIVRRAAVDAVGSFDPKLKARSDFEFCLRLVERFRLAATAEATVLSHESADSISGRIDYMRNDIAYVLDKHDAVFAKQPRVAARYWYLLAKAECLAGNRASGWKALRQSLARRPGCWRSWALLAASLCGSGAVRNLSQWRQRPSRSFER